MNTELNVAARRIFMRLESDISGRRGLGAEWDDTESEAIEEIRDAWAQIFTEEIERYENAKKSDDPPVGKSTTASKTLESAVKMNTQSIENIIAACDKTFERVSALESDNQRLKDRLNVIEGLGIPR